MLQTRSGRCPVCKEQTLPGVSHCPSCGTPLDWEAPAQASRPVARPEAAPATQSNDPPSLLPAIVRMLALVSVAVLLIFLAIIIRTRFFANVQSSEIESPHAVRVQDAESFRNQILAARSGYDAPELDYVLGVAMPAGSDILQITVKDEWKSLDYKTRLQHAMRVTERWKGVHAPHRSYFSLLDEAGNEIGGRGWTGKVWVQEKHEDAPRTRSTAAPASRTPTGANGDN